MFYLRQKEIQNNFCFCCYALISMSEKLGGLDNIDLSFKWKGNC